MTDVRQISEQKLSLGYWFVTHKLLLKNILIVILIIINITLLSYILFLLISNLAIFQKNYQDNLLGLVSTSPDYAAVRSYRLPQDIQTGALQSFSNATKGYDIITEIINPNLTWWATFDYQFKLGDKLTDKIKGYVFPNETRKLIQLGVDKGNLASSLVLSNIVWTKEINFINIYKERYSFKIKNIKYIPSEELGVGDELPINRLSFEVTNESYLDYRNVNFLLFLKSGGQIVAVNQVSSNIFKSGETKILETSFFQLLPKITSVDIIADVNILDQNSFIKK